MPEQIPQVAPSPPTPIQLLAPAILPPPNPNMPQFRGITFGEAQSGFGEFYANGKYCKVPVVVSVEKINDFFARCPKQKFMRAENPDCSCAALRMTMNDYGALTIKSGSAFYTLFGTGAGYPFLMLAILAVILVIVCAPFVYFFSYRMSRRELKESTREAFFMEWHRQRLSSLICLVMVCFGFVLLLMGVSGSSEISVFGLFKISTSLPGIVFALLGFLTWRVILTRTTGPREARNAAS